MRNILTLGILLALALCITGTENEPTQLTYFTEHEVEQKSDYIQISITVHCEDIVLKKAVEQANQIVQKLEKIVLSYCKDHAKSKKHCQDAFEASKHKIQPKYQLVRKVETFMAFIVSHEVTIKIKNLEGIGRMTDQLLQAGDGLITIDNFEWKAQNEQNPERQALRSGMEDGEQICSRMGLKLSRVISVQEVQEAQEQEGKKDEEEEEEKQEDEEQEEAEIIVFKFEVECA